MTPTNTPSERPEGRPGFERLTQIVMDHLFFAEHHPDKLDEIAARLECSSYAALAIAISDQICEEFTLDAREDD